MANHFPPGKYAWTVKVGEKGQFVIPKEARDVFDIHPGDTLIVLGDVNRGLAILPKDALDEIHSRIYDSAGKGAAADERHPD